MTERRKPILCVDFDGVVHLYSTPWTNAETVSDGAVPGALRWLWKATEWFTVTIYSSRSATFAGIKAMHNWMRSESIKEFGQGHPMSTGSEDLSGYPIEFASEKPPAFLTIDDRGVPFDGNWDDIGDPADLLNFKPWNKRPPIGPTGKFPEGKLREGDKGQLALAIGRNGPKVEIHFGGPVTWVAMTLAEARDLGALLIKQADQKAH